jgi:hypothetical protein
MEAGTWTFCSLPGVLGPGQGTAHTSSSGNIWQWREQSGRAGNTGVSPLHTPPESHFQMPLESVTDRTARVRVRRGRGPVGDRKKRRACGGRGGAEPHSKGGCSHGCLCTVQSPACWAIVVSSEKLRSACPGHLGASSSRAWRRQS